MFGLKLSELKNPKVSRALYAVSDDVDGAAVVRKMSRRFHKAIAAMLPHVPFDGWTRRALRHGLADIGAPLDDAELLFPSDAVDMVKRGIARW